MWMTGGTVVTLQGTGFAHSMWCKFTDVSTNASMRVAVEVASESLASCISPPGAVGSHLVQLVTPLVVCPYELNFTYYKNPQVAMAHVVCLPSEQTLTHMLKACKQPLDMSMSWRDLSYNTLAALFIWGVHAIVASTHDDPAQSWQKSTLDVIYQVEVVCTTLHTLHNLLLRSVLQFSLVFRCQQPGSTRGAKIRSALWWLDDQCADKQLWSVARAWNIIGSQVPLGLYTNFCCQNSHVASDSVCVWIHIQNWSCVLT